MRPSRLWLIVGGMAFLFLLRTSWRGVTAGEHERNAAKSPSLSASLERHSSFPFAEETPLSAVVDHLRRDLDAQVVLDLAALKRLKIDEKTPVRLELKDVKRSTGLRLLLDQVGLTFRAEDDDNLLILTDRQGAADPVDRIESRLDDLDRDVREIQDAVEEVYQTVAPEAEGPALRSPTLIEEVPTDGVNDAVPPPEPARADEDPVHAAARPRDVDTPDARQIEPPGVAPRAKVSWGGPRSLVLFVLAAVVVIGGGRRWLRSLRSRRLADRLVEPDVTREEILAASEGGRDGLFDLFRLLAPEIDEPRRLAAGEALAILWKRDQLVAEEEKGIVTRGVAVTWLARRRYPRRMTAPISITVAFRVPFLGASPSGVQEENLEWSYRLKGTERLSLESFSPWLSGPGRLSFTVDPDDFPGNGPHRLIFQPRVRPKGLTSSWELELPQSSMSFDFDPNLDVDSIRTLHDSEREVAMNHALALVPLGEDGSTPLALNEEFALRAVPIIRLAEALPCDLAHRIELEIEGIAGRFPGGSVVAVAGSGPRSFPIESGNPLPVDTIPRPGPYRMRAVLTADSSLGWADPDVRSLWPGTITTPWADVKIVRR